MSKLQRLATKWLPVMWHTLSKGLYFTMLREAAKIAGDSLRSLPPSKQQKTTGKAGSSLVRNDSDDEDSESGAEEAGDFDTVTEEAKRWENLDKKIVREFTDMALAL